MAKRGELRHINTAATGPRIALLASLRWGKRAKRLEIRNLNKNGLYECIQLLRFATLFFFCKNVVFPAQAEYSYFSADFRLKIFLYYS